MEQEIAHIYIYIKAYICHFIVLERRGTRDHFRDCEIPFDFQKGTGGGGERENRKGDPYPNEHNTRMQSRSSKFNSLNFLKFL